METSEIIVLIKKAIVEAESLGEEDNFSALKTKKILQLLRTEIESNPLKIRVDVLKAMHDVGMSSYKEFENTPLEDAINNITEWLYLEIPLYKQLNPLGADFVKWVNDL
jgi:hypothetical protein